MAQEKLFRLARRYGIGAGRTAAVVLAVLVALVAAALLARGAATQTFEIERQSEAAEVADEKPVEVEEAAPARITVHVDGAVASPGVYELDAGSRVNDVVTCAGGLAGDADTSGINLAAALADGEKVHVPREGEESAPAASAQGSPAAGEPSPGRVNINTATAAELQALPGVGESTARAIVEDRERLGPFLVPEDLMRVSGIGEKKFAKLEGRICV